MIDAVVDSLATYRLVRLVLDDGIFDTPREHVRESLRVAGYDKLLELAECPWCLSVWCAAGVVAARTLVPRAWGPVARALAFSTVAGAIDRAVN